MEILHVVTEVDDRITHELPRAVVSRLSAAINRKQRMRQMGRAAETRLIGRASDRVNRIVLEEQQLVGDVSSSTFASDNFFLLHQRIREADPAEPTCCESVVHICAPAGTPSRAASCERRCVRPMASASAASLCGVSVNPSIARTINATWFLSAPPRPTVACFIRVGAYSNTGRPRSAAARIAAPRAAPSAIAVL